MPRLHALWFLALLAASLARPDGADVRVVSSHPLPALDGTRLRATLVEVRYGPGESSSPHGHPCPVVGYVIEGRLRVAVDGGVDSVFSAGESFYEAPNGVHRISANASQTEPVRFLAWFTCDRETALSTPAP